MNVKINFIPILNNLQIKENLTDELKRQLKIRQTEITK